MTRPIRGLGYAGDCSQPGSRFGSHTEVRRRCWAQLAEGGSSAAIAELAGACSREEVENVLAERAGDADPPTLVDTWIDGRRAWMWRQKAWGRGSVAAAIPYDDATFIVSLGGPAPDEAAEGALLAAVTSFERSPGRLAGIVVPLACVVLAGLAGWAWWRRRTSPRPADRPDASARPF